MEIEIVADKCIGCGKCVENCPGSVLSITSDGSHGCVSVANKDFCLGCKRCTRLCPNHAIKVRKSQKGENKRVFISPRFLFVSFSFLIGLMVILFFFN